MVLEIYLSPVYPDETSKETLNKATNVSAPTISQAQQRKDEDSISATNDLLRWPLEHQNCIDLYYERTKSIFREK